VPTTLVLVRQGAADGMSIEEFARVYGGFNDEDLDHPISPGGESMRMFNALGVPMLFEPGASESGNPRNTSMTVLVGDGRWTLARYNDAAHVLPG
jgi:hypothetical protein